MPNQEHTPGGAHTSTAREVAAARVEVLFSKTKSISPSEIGRRSKPMICEHRGALATPGPCMPCMQQSVSSAFVKLHYQKPENQEDKRRNFIHGQAELSKWNKNSM
jgi:hypothetical protein